MPTHWMDIQQNTFTRWVNDELKRRGMKVEDLKTDLKDGLMLINLMEIISGKSVGRYNRHPTIIAQKMENLNIALKFIQDEGIKLVNVGSEDIHTGNLRIILGLIWTLILRYEIKRGSHGDDTNAADDLMKWVQSKIPDYNIKNWNKNWNDGRAVCALCDAVRPGTFPGHADLDPNDKLNNATKGIDAADSIGVDKLLLPDEMTNPKVDKLAMMTYIAQFRNLPEETHDHLRCKAYGPGLVEGVVDEAAPFTVVVPKDVKGKLEVKVEGPNDMAPVEIKEDDGIYSVSYKPSTPGLYKVHVTLDGKHIPGSTFFVTVLEQESLGGEGKIRVFYSTTSSNQKARNDFKHLQMLFQSKSVHLREDFEPWIPVDIMDKKDRDAVFRKANTRTLPIVFIDDVYQGDYDKMVELNESGKLDELLKMDKQKLVSEEEHYKRLRGHRVSVALQDFKVDDQGNPVDNAQLKASQGGSSAPAPARPAPSRPAPKRPAAAGGKCPSCGVAASGKFCSECGHKL